MSQDKELRDQQMMKWLKKGGGSNVSPDFTDRVMQKISAEPAISVKKEAWFHKPWLYFAISLISLPFAVFAAIEYFEFLASSFKEFVSVQAELLGYTALIVFCLIMLYQLDQFLRYRTEKKLASNMQ